MLDATLDAGPGGIHKCGATPSPVAAEGSLRSTLTLSMYPHILDAVLSYADFDTQTRLRLVSRGLRAAVDAAHSRHVALRTAMCREPGGRAAGVYLVIARPSREVRRDSDPIYGYFYCGGAVPGLGYDVTFAGVRGAVAAAALGEPPARAAHLLHAHTAVLDVYPNDVDWEFTTPRAQLEGAVAALNPERVHTLRYAEEVDPWWYTRTLLPRTVVFDLRHLDAQRPEKHSTHSYLLANDRIPSSADTVVVHIPVAQWRFNHPPLAGFAVHEGTAAFLLVFRNPHAITRHAVEWDGQAPPLGILHKFLQDNRAHFPRLRLTIAGAEHVSPRVFGRAFNATPVPINELRERLVASIGACSGTLGWTDAQVARTADCIDVVSLADLQDATPPDLYELYTAFPHYPC